LGNQPFMGLEIKVSPAALIPRPETEGLVCEALELLKPRAEEPLTLLELGTGTGCIAIALARALPQATIYATDVSQAALRLAEQNALAHHVARRIRFVQEDLFGASGPRGWADLAISNPPYIPTAELARLEPELLCEPRLALDGGKDGLAAIRAIVAAAPGVLKPGGWLALEIGSEQGQSALGLLADAGFEERRVRKDLQGLDRVALARR
ncbi:MAG: peptide chain release factor N(5)-glutamine methyltransferase, partial [Elusimicrobia bacterium]|nr:peptide chain release factor N(5)-glutamine methyltransferase [Elusimicrobiota bacterium]